MEVIAAHPDVRKFIDGLEDSASAKTGRLLDLLSERGPNLGMPMSRPLKDPLFELRILGTQNVRILYTIFEGKIFLLYAFAKKSQKLSSRDLVLARARLALLRRT